MKGYELLDAVGGIDAEFVKAADRPVKRKQLPRVVGWIATAACLCLVIGIIVPHITGKGGLDTPISEGEDSVVKDMVSLEFNGAYYEATDIPEVLERFGLPTVLTEKLAGDRLSWLTSDNRVHYQESVAETEIELLEYAPSPCRGVYIIRDGSKYYAALFCGINALDSNASTELETLYQIYGIQAVEDLVSIAEVDWNRNKVIGDAVTDQDELAEFFQASKALTSHGNDSFQGITFDGIPEEQQAEKHIAFANDLRELRLETKDGLRFYIGVFPTFGWISGDGVLSYYQINEQMEAWLERNLR